MDTETSIDIDAIERQFRPAEIAKPPADPEPAPVQEIEDTAPATSQPVKWSDVESVKKLNDHLKKCRGYRLMIGEDGRLIMHFIGGVDKSDKERWRQAVKAVDLLMAAADDILGLHEIGEIKLKVRDYKTFSS